MDEIWSILSSFNNILLNCSLSFPESKNSSAIFLSFVNDKKVFEKIIAPVKFSFLEFTYFLISLISLLDNLLPLYNSLLKHMGNDCNLIPSYKTFIKVIYLSFLFSLKSLFRTL